MTQIQFTPQPLSQLWPQCPAEHATRMISAICDDHREINHEQTLFFARRTASGQTFAEQALQAGAQLVLADADVIGDAAVLNTTNPAAVLAEIIRNSQGWSKMPLAITAITGTNGKTSVAFLLAQLLAAVGVKPALLGTLGAGCVQPDGAVKLAALKNTTPGVLESWRWLLEFAAQGVEQVVMEVSSHALDQGRVAGLPITQAIFTQISRDHLDYHPDFASYQAAKLSLLDHPGLKSVIMDADSSWADAICKRAKIQSLQPAAFSLEQHNDAVLNADINDARLTGTTVAYQHNPLKRADPVQSGLIGRFNVRNLSAALLAAEQLGLRWDALLGAVPKLTAPTGRMQRVARAGSGTVFIDYAHTPDALEQVLHTLRTVLAPTGLLWVVFGCGGGRDTGKRPLMGSVAAALADRVVLTSDNPRDEDPDQIIADILTGIAQPQHTVSVEPDRKAAIAHALAALGADDCLLVAGKGHEQGQIVSDRVIAFDDYHVVQQASQQAQGTVKATTGVMHD